jgi:replication-associated recombination protein RarA
MPSLHEQYRPKCLSEIVGQDAALKQVQRVLSRSWGARAWWITGASGTGKTTLAYAIANEGADDLFIDELDASTLTPAKIREIEDSFRFRALGSKPGKCFIVNEAHGLRKDAIRMLLVVLERLPEHVVFVFTTTKAGQEFLFDTNDCGDAAPLVSRCIEIELSADDATQAAFARRAKQIAKQEGIDGLPDSIYSKAISAVRGNMRALLQRIESGKFRSDARESLEKELQMIKATKGEYADGRRAQLTAAIASLA